MKAANIVLIAICLFLITACAASRKKKIVAAPPAPVAATTPPALPTAPASPAPAASPVMPFLSAKPADGIYDPGNDELAAIQVQHKEVTLAKLKEGYKIYTQGACINCHNAKGIYQFQERDWKGIMDDMAQKAMLSDVQKDAVYKYVLAIKATQPK